MSRRTCSNSNWRGSTSPEARPQNMNASSGSGLCPRRICKEPQANSARSGPYTGPAMAKPTLSDAIQDYLKAIYHLQHDGDRVSVTALAREQKVAAASASGMVKKLAALGLVEHAPYRGVRLTRWGESGRGGDSPSPAAGALPRQDARTA